MLLATTYVDDNVVVDVVVAIATNVDVAPFMLILLILLLLMLFFVVATVALGDDFVFNDCHYCLPYWFLNMQELLGIFSEYNLDNI